MVIISTAKMAHGTFQAKFLPLSMLTTVKKIYVLRKEMGPKIDKLHYIILPKICRFSFFNLIITPFYLLYFTIKLKADLILSYHLVPHAFFAYFCSLITKKPFIFAQTGGHSQILFQRFFLKVFISKIFNRAKYVLVPGKQSQEFWKSYFKESVKIEVLHSTINTEKFKSDDNIDKDIDVLYVGSLVKRKQVDLIIDSFNDFLKLNPETKLGIVGTGPLEDLLKRKVYNFHIQDNVKFYGFQKNVLNFLQRSKIFIMASKVEGLPVALMEAMSCEKTVIAPSVDNIPTVLINNKTGYLLNKENTKNDISEVLDSAYKNYSEGDFLMKNARDIIVENYSYNSSILKWQVILNKIRLK